MTELVMEKLGEKEVEMAHQALWTPLALCAYADGVEVLRKALRIALAASKEK